MLHEDGEQGVAHPDALQPGGDLAGDLVQAFAAGGHLQAVRYYLHGFTGWETVLTESDSCRNWQDFCSAHSACSACRSRLGGTPARSSTPILCSLRFLCDLCAPAY